MALGDGIRRNIRTISREERDRFARALLALQGKKFPDVETDAAPSAMRDWFRQIEIHLEEREHGGAEFLPWHRELCNRAEQMLREIDPTLSLHYWDWTEGPSDLFTPGFLDDTETGARASLGPDVSDAQLGGVSTAPDSVIVRAPSYRRLRALLERKRDKARVAYFGGTIVDAHISFHDPLALLLHSNVDRLYAMWQAQSGQSWRLDPGRVYGEEDEMLRHLFVEPWSTELPARPWVNPASPHTPKTHVHPSVVAPPCYDTLPAHVVVDDIANAHRRIRFTDVYAGKTFARAASFRIYGRGNLRFSVTDGPTGPYKVITPGAAVTVAHAPNLYQEARIWFGYTGEKPETSAPRGRVTIHCDQTNEDFVFTLHANTIAVPAAGPVAPPGTSDDESDPPFGASPPGVTWTWTWRAVSA